MEAQLYIRWSRPVEAGEKYRLTMDVRADADASSTDTGATKSRGV